MSELLSYGETQKLLDELDKEHQKLMAEIVPSQITVAGIQRVLQNLLSERISIRDLPTILEGISEACAITRNVLLISEHVRARLSRQLSDKGVDDAGIIPIVTLSPEWAQIEKLQAENTAMKVGHVALQAENAVFEARLVRLEKLVGEKQ